MWSRSSLTSFGSGLDYGDKPEEVRRILALRGIDGAAAVAAVATFALSALVLVVLR